MNRDYDKELADTKDHKYAYNFDHDVMHPFIIKACEQYFIDADALELGSHYSDFTERLLKHFSKLTCVEVSEKAIEIAKSRLKESNVEFIQSSFQKLILNKKYNNVFLTHVLEHLDDPVQTLRKINDEWLTDKGRLFLVCPNANAPSRQIAVKMGLISHNAAVTEAEAEHGHRITYSLDTLERDARLAGLSVIHRSGIFFKALANFQWDLVLENKIVSDEYLEGCFQLGHIYPDLCSSIFLVCEKGKRN